MELTSTRTFTIPDDVMNEIACDLITAAVEGGIGYWSVASNYRWGDPTIGHSHKQANGSTEWQEGDKQYATVILDDAAGDDFKGIMVDAAKVIEAITKLLSGEVKEFYTQGYTKTFRTRLTEALDAIERARLAPTDHDLDFDAGDADCVVQIACFGEVVYG